MRKLLFFHASWCPPCKFYEKQFILPLEARAGPDRVTRIDAQNEPFTADKYMVDKLPMAVLIDGDMVIFRRTGAIDVDKVADFLEGGDGFD